MPFVRDVKLTKRILEENGYTDGRAGCTAMQEGTTRRVHPKFCRSRIAEKLGKTAAGRKTLPEAEERFKLSFQEPQRNLSVSLVPSGSGDPSGEVGDEEGSGDSCFDDEIFGLEDVDGILAWIGPITRGTCKPDDVRRILKEVEAEIGEDMFKSSSIEVIDDDISEIYSPARIALRGRKH